MDLENSLTKELKANELQITKDQKNFLETTLWKVVDAGLNTGIRALLPDLIENEVITVKNEIVKNGFKAGAKQAINSAIDMGKSLLGIVTGNFETITQAQNAIKSGGIIDGISNVLDYSIDKATKKNVINQEIGNIIKKSKNVVLNTIEANIEEKFKNQQSSIEIINSCSENWKNCFNNQDFKGMDKEYKIIKENFKELLPLEKTIKQVRELENVHLLIKNNGKNFNISNEELELSKILV